MFNPGYKVQIVVLVTQLCLTLVTPKPTRLLCSWDSPGKNMGVGCLPFLQRIFPTQGLNPGFLDCRQILYCLSYREVPKKSKADTSNIYFPLIDVMIKTNPKTLFLLTYSWFTTFFVKKIVIKRNLCCTAKWFSFICVCVCVCVCVYTHILFLYKKPFCPNVV